jgi:hypothetical protein
MSYSQKPQEALNLLVTEERFRALFCIPLYTFLHNLLDALVQIANKMELQQMYIEIINVILQRAANKSSPFFSP